MTAPVASTSGGLSVQDSADIMPAFNAWRQMLSSFTGLALSEEQKGKQRQVQSAEQMQKDCKRCEAWRDEVIGESVFTYRSEIKPILLMSEPNIAQAQLCASCWDMSIRCRLQIM